MEPPGVSVGTAAEYAYWMARLNRFLADRGADPDSIEQVDARYNYRSNRITLYRLRDESDVVSVAETLAHETLHAVLYQLGEGWAARAIDLVARPARSNARIGGI